MRVFVAGLILLISTLPGMALNLHSLANPLVNIQNFTPIPRPDFVQQQCGPPNCCLNPQCRRRYQSEWKPDLGRCGGCSVQ
jgi:hypothetical protein